MFEALLMNTTDNWDFDGADTQYLTHNFHPFAARFIPQIPLNLIESYSMKGETVLDPFSGSGTTLVECKLTGRNGIGVDINPLFALIARVKTTPLSNIQQVFLHSWRNALCDFMTKFYGQVKLSCDQNNRADFKYTIPDWERIDHWFSETAKRELAAIMGEIKRVNDIQCREFLLCGLSSIIVRVSHQDGETRYAQSIRTVKATSVFKAFIQKIDDMIERINKFSEICTNSKIELFSHDSRNLKFLKDESVHLVVTSPPYMNAYDYHKYHRQRMLWLEIDPHPVRKAEIGGHDKYTKPDANPETYFSDMRDVMREMLRLLKPQRYAFIVIGDSIVKGIKIPSQERLVQMGSEIGFEEATLFKRNVDASRKSFGAGSRLKEEHIVCLKKH
jgi:DNA modification methylase